MGTLKSLFVGGLALLVGGAALLCDHVAKADSLESAPVKHLAPPKGHMNKRLMDPSITPRQSGPGRQPFKWLWGDVSTSRAAANASRWSLVLQVIEKGRSSGKDVFGSRAAAKRTLAEYREYLEREAQRRNGSVPILVAVIAVGSNGNRMAKSPKGTGDLMQLMPKTAKRFGVSDRYLPAQNIRGGAHYLDWLLRHYDEDAALAVAGYNAGQGAVDRHDGVSPFADSRGYVARVAGAYAAECMLCTTPPRSPRGPCLLK